MSTAPSKTGCFNSFATNLQDETGPATSTQLASSATTEATAPLAFESLAAGSRALTDDPHQRQPTNLPLTVSGLVLGLKDGPRIWGNRLPPHDERPILCTVRIKNKPADVTNVAMNVIVSERGKDSKMNCRSGKFSKYVSSMTYKKTVPIATDALGHSITVQIEVGHVTAHSGHWHDGDGPYDVYMSVSPIGAGSHEAENDKRSTVRHEHGDEDAVAQTEETLRFTLYSSKTHFLARLHHAVSRVWGWILAYPL